MPDLFEIITISRSFVREFRRVSGHVLEWGLRFVIDENNV